MALSELEGIWYLDGDTAAEDFLDIRDDGSWTYYQRYDGQPESTQADSGYLTHGAEGGSHFDAVSEETGVSYPVFLFDTGILVWGEDDHYFERME